MLLAALKLNIAHIVSFSRTNMEAEYTVRTAANSQFEPAELLFPPEGPVCADLFRESRLLFAASTSVTWPLEQLGSSQELGS